MDATSTYSLIGLTSSSIGLTVGILWKVFKPTTNNDKFVRVDMCKVIHKEVDAKLLDISKDVKELLNRR